MGVNWFDNVAGCIYNKNMLIFELPKPIEFEWDMGNQIKSYLKHNIATTEAEQAFFSRHLMKKDEIHSITEECYHLLGSTDEGRTLLISFTIRGRKIRVISARPADKQERKIYAEEIKKNP